MFRVVTGEVAGGAQRLRLGYQLQSRAPRQRAPNPEVREQPVTNEGLNTAYDIDGVVRSNNLLGVLNHANSSYHGWHKCWRSRRCYCSRRPTEQPKATLTSSADFDASCSKWQMKFSSRHPQAALGRNLLRSKRCAKATPPGTYSKKSPAVSSTS